jgi:hypothetical protein
MIARWAFALASVTVVCCAFGVGLARADQLEPGVNRPYGDYKDFNVVSPSLCQSACLYDEKCKAWTYVNPGPQDKGRTGKPMGHCWMKNSVPKPVKDSCCISGVTSYHGCVIGGVLRKDIEERDCEEARTTGCIRRLLSDAAYKACLRAQPVVSSGCLIGGVMRKDIADKDCKEAQQTGCIKRLLTDQQYQSCLQAQKTAGGGGSSAGSLNSKVLQYALGKVGVCVKSSGAACVNAPPDGECTHLVEAALRAAGAWTGSNYVWGTQVSNIQPGDIIQFTDTKFTGPNLTWSTAIPGHHTAIVKSVNGSRVILVHQNDGERKVHVGILGGKELDLNWPHSGSYIVYRPKPA